MKIKLKKISFYERMSEETNCFAADLYINGKRTGYCKNDGQGGCTFYHGYDLEGNQLIAEAEAYFLSLPKVKGEGLNFMRQPTLESAIDDQFELYLKAKEIKKKKKNMEYGILYGVPNGMTYAMIKYKQPLAELVKSHKPYLIKKILEIKTNECKNGIVILNTNLAELGLNV